MAEDKKRQSHGERKRTQILNYIRYYMIEHRYPPTVREIGEGVNLSSTSTVYSHLKKLEEQGLLTMSDRETRTVVPSDIKVVLMDAK